MGVDNPRIQRCAPSRCLFLNNRLRQACHELLPVRPLHRLVRLERVAAGAGARHTTRQAHGITRHTHSHSEEAVLTKSPPVPRHSLLDLARLQHQQCTPHVSPRCLGDAHGELLRQVEPLLGRNLGQHGDDLVVGRRGDSDAEATASHRVDDLAGALAAQDEPAVGGVPVQAGVVRQLSPATTDATAPLLSRNNHAYFSMVRRRAACASRVKLSTSVSSTTACRGWCERREARLCGPTTQRTLELSVIQGR